MGTELWINGKEIVKIKLNKSKFSADSILQLKISSEFDFFKGWEKSLLITNKETGKVYFFCKKEKIISEILSERTILNTSETILYIENKCIMIPSYIKISLSSGENFYFLIKEGVDAVDIINKRLELSKTGIIRVDDLGKRLYFS